MPCRRTCSTPANWQTLRGPKLGLGQSRSWPRPHPADFQKFALAESLKGFPDGRSTTHRLASGLLLRSLASAYSASCHFLTDYHCALNEMAHTSTDSATVRNARFWFRNSPETNVHHPKGASLPRLQCCVLRAPPRHVNNLLLETLRPQSGALLSPPTVKPPQPKRQPQETPKPRRTLLSVPKP
jgi:hypothetical protein